MTRPTFRSVTYIGAPIDRVWDALTLPEFTAQYFHATRIETDWRQGSDLAFVTADGRKAAHGKILRVEKPTLLAFSWSVAWTEQMAAEPPSRVTYELAVSGETTRLTVTHDEFPERSTVHAAIEMGWPGIVSSLKSLLETGAPLIMG